MATRHPTKAEIEAALRVIESLYAGVAEDGTLAFCPPDEFEPDCICCVAGRLHEAMVDYVDSEMKATSS